MSSMKFRVVFHDAGKQRSRMFKHVSSAMRLAEKYDGAHVFPHEMSPALYYVTRGDRTDIRWTADVRSGN